MKRVLISNGNTDELPQQCFFASEEPQNKIENVLPVPFDTLIVSKQIERDIKQIMVDGEDLEITKKKT